jgi:hypothetical protein
MGRPGCFIEYRGASSERSVGNECLTSSTFELPVVSPESTRQSHQCVDVVQRDHAGDDKCQLAEDRKLQFPSLPFDRRRLELELKPLRGLATAHGQHSFVREGIRGSLSQEIEPANHVDAAIHSLP